MQATSSIKGREGLYGLLPYLVLALLSVLLYGRTIGYGFYMDDTWQIVNNELIKGFSSLGEIFSTSSLDEDSNKTNTYRPLVYATFIFSYAISGLKPWSYHLLSITLHTVNGMLAYRFASILLDPARARGVDPARAGGGDPARAGRVDPARAGRLDPARVGQGEAASDGGRDDPFRIYGPFTVAAIFLLHPVNAEVATWVADIPELGYTCFSLIGLIFFLKDGEIRFTNNIFAALALFVAILFKEPAATVFLMVLLYSLISLRVGYGEGGDVGGIGSRLLTLGLKLSPFLVVTVLYLLLRLDAAGGVVPRRYYDLTGYEALLNGIYLFGTYMGKLLLPLNLNALHTYTPVTSLMDVKVLAASTPFIVALYLFYRWRGTPDRLLTLFIVTLPLLPVLYIPVVAVWPFNERYLYLPTIGFGVILVTFVRALFGKLEGRIDIRTIYTVTALLLSISFLWSFNRSGVWKDEVSLMVDISENNPGNFKAHNNLGNVLLERGEYREAERYYKMALSVKSDNFETIYNLGYLYERTGELEESIRYYKAFIAGAPPYFQREKGAAVVTVRRLERALELKGRSGAGSR